MTEFKSEISDGGQGRRMKIGSSFAELDETIRLYFPDESDRLEFYLELLEGAINQGRLNGYVTNVTPDNPDLDLSDERISHEVNEF